MTALTVNVGAASVERAERIRAWLRRRDEQVIVLTEVTGGAGSRLLEEDLTARGYVVLKVPAGDDRGVLLASRLRVITDLTPVINSTMPWRAVGAVIGTSDPIAVVGVYAPSRDRKNGKALRKRRFLESVITGLQAVDREVDHRWVLLGDFNAVPRDHNPKHGGFLSWEYAWHDHLDALGLRNAPEILGHPQPHSWIGRTGNAYLYDYAEISAALHDDLLGCSYLHETRTALLTDHAAVALELKCASRTSVS